MTILRQKFGCGLTLQQTLALQNEAAPLSLILLARSSEAPVAASDVGRTPQEIVGAAYRAYLGREASADEVAFHVRSLMDNGPVQAIRGIALSREATIRASVLPQEQVCQVARLQNLVLLNALEIGRFQCSVACRTQNKAHYYFYRTTYGKTLAEAFAAAGEACRIAARQNGFWSVSVEVPGPDLALKNVNPAGPEDVCREL